MYQKTLACLAFCANSKILKTFIQKSILQNMISFDKVIGENRVVQNCQQLDILDHCYRILIFGGAATR